MDSLGLTMSIGRELLLQIASIYKCDGDILTIRKLGVQQQVGKMDCGLFAVAYAVEVCHGKNPAVTCFDQTKMRHHMYDCLCKGKLVPFPQVRSGVRKNLILRATAELVWYGLYCFCAMPEEYEDMVECDKCSRWMHCSCAGLNNVNEVLGVVWWCSEC